MPRIDLHLHTTYSDGSHSPAEVIQFAHEAGVTALAITDHDTVDGLPEAITAALDKGIKVIPGIELSSRFEGQDTHILGYFFDWQDGTFQTRLTEQQENREQRNPRVVDKLNQLGLELTYEEVKAMAGTGSIGRPHIANVLVAKGYVSSTKEAFDRYLADGASAYVERESPDTREAIAWIREAGGVPVLAHPHWTKRKGPELIEMCRTLKEAGLMGIEVFYSTHSKRQTSEFLELARKLDLLMTGGSDFHGTAKPGIYVGRGKGDLKVTEKLLEPLRKKVRT
ncbi:PHP domain-containing protein [Candidatus Nitronereus thalassa]|uniref:PHP domain-containing protein n=1 Tax=Candidatus Nitronereus thalassa TaxID=3020898 RepID=A0ABU3K6E1_9BACT|nr:PHP domain-containing protein [Candidatus Nitronereus thalassa]MDT7041936.1 PHP domain-containing protein [Candidatus Nitronereus thalassa]